MEQHERQILHHLMHRGNAQLRDLAVAELLRQRRVVSP
jgi:hypothetical protein